MSESKTDQLITWLNSAYAMEETLVKVLENHAKDAEDFPEIQARDEQHLEETRRHLQRVKYCLELLGEKPSTTKSIVGNLSGMVQSVSTGMYNDELVKNFLQDYAAEHFEIACYTSLISAAHEVGRPEIAEICREILQDEQDMADWLLTKIPEVTQLFLQMQTAKQ
jgi:ferritin-like metal-binding protein YciE